MNTRQLGIWMALLALLAGCAVRGDLSGGPVPGPWTDSTGRTVRFQEWRGQTVVLSMFYSTCSRFCPRTLFRMKAIQKAMDEKGERAHFVLVTLDPRHDTPARLAAYHEEHRLNARWSLLRGSTEATKSLAQRLNIFRIEDAQHLFHLPRIVVFGPDGLESQSE